MEILINGHVINKGYFEVSRKVTLQKKKSHPQTPFIIVRLLKELKEKGAKEDEYLPYFNRETRVAIEKAPWLLSSFLNDLDERVEISEIIPDGLNYIVRTRRGQTIYMERVGTTEDFRIDLVSHQ